MESTLVNYENLLKIDEWDKVCESRDFLEFLSKVKSDNFLVQNEMNLLLKAALLKAEKLDQTRKEKVVWFLNDNLDQNITEVCHTYLVG